MKTRKLENCVEWAGWGEYKYAFIHYEWWYKLAQPTKVCQSGDVYQNPTYPLIKSSFKTLYHRYPRMFGE